MKRGMLTAPLEYRRMYKGKTPEFVPGEQRASRIEQEEQRALGSDAGELGKKWNDIFK